MITMPLCARPFRSLALFVAALLAFVGLSSWSTGEDKPAAAAAPQAKVVFVTRHCEKDTHGDPRDPTLSEAGQKRAQLLGRMLRDAGVTQVFTSEYKRTQETAAAIGGVPNAGKHVVPGGKPEELFAALDALDGGEVALVVGHSNTTPAVLAHYGWKQLGADGKPVTAFSEEEYGYVYAITVLPAASKVAPTIVRLRYGD